MSYTAIQVTEALDRFDLRVREAVQDGMDRLLFDSMMSRMLPEIVRSYLNDEMNVNINISTKTRIMALQNGATGAMAAAFATPRYLFTFLYKWKKEEGKPSGVGENFLMRQKESMAKWDAKKSKGIAGAAVGTSGN